MDYAGRPLKSSLGGKRKENGILKEPKLLKSKSFSGSSTDLLELQDLTNRLMHDKTCLQQRLEQSLASERELTLELERLRRRIGDTDVTGRRASPSPTRNSMEKFLQRVEEDRDYWKQEATLLAQLIVKQKCGGDLGNSGSMRELGRHTRELIQHLASSKSDRIWERKLLLMQEELKRCKLENERLVRSRNRSVSPPGATRPGRTLSRGFSPAVRERSFTRDHSEEVERLRSERDSLQKMLDRFERQLQEIQSNARILTQERDRLHLLQEESQTEIQHLRQELMTAVSSMRASTNNLSAPPPAIQQLMKRLQTERDEAALEKRRLMTERDTMRERLRVATERDLAERARLEQCLEDVENQLRRQTNEKEEAGLRCQQLRQQCTKLENDVEIVRKQLLERGLQQNSDRDALRDVRTELETTQRHKTELERNLCRLESALVESDDRSRILDERIRALEKEITTSREENSKMRVLITQLDSQRETLHSSAEDRLQQIHALKMELNTREQSLAEMRSTLKEVEKQLVQDQEMMQQSEREAKSFRKQIENLQSALEQEVRHLEQAKKENARLQTDYEKVKNERDTFFTELEETMDEREDLREQVKEYLLQVQRIENLVSEKENERNRLVEQLRLLSMDGDRCQLEIRRLEEELTKMRLEMATREEEVDTMRLRWEQSQADLTDAHELAAQQAREVSSLSRSIEETEIRLKQSDLQQQELLRDMSSLRELCSRLENSKDTLQRQLSSTQLDSEQLRLQIKEMDHEVELLRDQILSEQDNVHKLEGLLAKAREQQFQSQMDSQESATEMSMLKDRLELQETKADHQQRELTRLRARNTELETNVDRVNRQLTTEKFEKERVLQDLRRCQQQIIQLESGLGLGDAALSLDVANTCPLSTLNHLLSTAARITTPSLNASSYLPVTAPCFTSYSSTVNSNFAPDFDHVSNEKRRRFSTSECSSSSSSSTSSPASSPRSISSYLYADDHRSDHESNNLSSRSHFEQLLPNESAGTCATLLIAQREEDKLDDAIQDSSQSLQELDPS